ncbi:MAG: carbohydrate kinase family protein [Lentisphaeria bacterium]|nr:carbohydrate kinase family protein [Lentisphaeria bacterium]NQZ66503.1 carbohydrate kinase family protein [Lentisphaeria bacterium]
MSDLVGCVGLLVADTFCGPMDRLPNEGELVMTDGFVTKLGGNAANVGLDLAIQGISVDVVGMVGDDDGAKIIIDGLSAAGVGTDQISKSDTSCTSQTSILLVRGEDRRYCHNFGANAELTTDSIDLAWLKTLTVFYLGGLFAMPGLQTEGLLTILKEAKEAGVITMVDVVLPETHKGYEGLDKLLPYIDIFTPNDDEAELITGLSDPVEQAKALHAYGANKVIITLGGNGALAYDGETIWRSGIFKMDAIDMSGCGDAFVSGIIAAQVKNLGMADMLSYASAIGASATRKIGCSDGIFTSSEVEDFLKTESITMSTD